MEELLNSIYAQTGALGLLAISGWMMWWFERKERLNVRTKYDEMYVNYMSITSELKDIMEPLNDYFDIKQLLEHHD